MARHGIKINRFDGGLNTKAGPEYGELNESPDLNNVDFDDLGAVKSRGGRASIGTLGSGPVTLLHPYLSDTNDAQLLIGCDGNLTYWNGTSFVPCSGGTGVMTAGVQVYAVNAQNNAFLCNGSDRMYRWNGESMVRWGITQASGMPYPAHYAGSSQTDPGHMAYIKSHEDVFGSESLAGSSVTSYDVLGASGNYGFQFVLTAPAASAGVAYINVYRKMVGSQTEYYLLTSVANDGSDSTVIDNFMSTLASSQVFSTVVDPKPPSLQVVCHHIGTMFGAGPANPTYLYYSEINIPTQWAADHFVRVGDGDGLPIKGLIQYGANLLITKDDGKGSGSCWVLYTPNAEPLNWQITRLNVGYGSVASKALIRFNNFIMLLNKNGIYDLAEGTVGESIMNPMSYKIEPDALALTDGTIKDSVAVTFKNKVYMTVPVDGNLRNNRIWVYDFVQGRESTEKQAGAWAVWDNMDMAQVAVYEDELFAGDYYGSVHQLDTGNSDQGAAIDSYFKTMMISGLDEHKDNLKVWRFIWVTVETTGDWNLNVTYGDDLTSEAGTTETIDLDPDASYWGTAIMGTDHYGRGVVRRTAKIILRNQVSKKIQVKFSMGTANQNWKVYDLMCEYNLQGVR